MLKKSRTAIRFLAALGFCTVLSVPSFPQSKATVQRVAILGNERGIQVQITATQPIPTQSQLLTGPDRLVIDFANALPGSQLRALSGSGEMKGVRVGLYKSNPPVTRIVLDLKSAQPYQLFPSGNTVVVKLSLQPLES